MLNFYLCEAGSLSTCQCKRNKSKKSSFRKHFLNHTITKFSIISGSNQINECLRGDFDRIDWNQGLKQNFGKVMKILDLSSETPRRGSMQKPTDYISESKLLE